MHALYRFAAAAHPVESLIELRQIGKFHHQMKFADGCGTEAELAPHQPPALHQSVVFQAVHVGFEPVTEFDVGYARFQVEPRVVNGHGRSRVMAAHNHIATTLLLSHPIYDPATCPSPAAGFLASSQ